MPFSYATDGAIATRQGGNDIAGASTGIGFGANRSGADPGNFTVSTADVVCNHIGDGALATSASNTGNVIQEPLTITAGSGYTNGTYRIQSNNSGGQGAGAGEIEITISGGAVTAARVVRPGQGFTSAPTFTVANAVNIDTGAGPGAGTLGAVTCTVATGSRVNSLGAAHGTNKGIRNYAASGSVNNGSAVSATYLNRSGRTMVSGDEAWCVAP
jgi:hypothetical protein